MPRAYCGTFSASRTFLRVHGREKICNMNRVMAAGLFAFHAADTSGTAQLAENVSLVAAAAKHNGLLFHRNHSDKLFGAGLGALRTPCAALRNDHRRSVADPNRSELARFRTVAQSDAAV